MRMAVHLIWVEWVIDKQHKPIIQKLRAIGAFFYSLLFLYLMAPRTMNNCASM